MQKRMTINGFEWMSGESITPDFFMERLSILYPDTTSPEDVRRSLQQLERFGYIKIEATDGVICIQIPKGTFNLIMGG